MAVQSSYRIIFILQFYENCHGGFETQLAIGAEIAYGVAGLQTRHIKHDSDRSQLAYFVEKIPQNSPVHRLAIQQLLMLEKTILA